MLRIIKATDRTAVARLLDPSRTGDKALERRVARIVRDVARSGDPALVKYAKKFDRLDGPIEVSRDEIDAGARTAPVAVRQAIARAARHIRVVARRQVPGTGRIQVAPGVTVDQRVIPLARVGCYVPGGRHPLPSSLLMAAVPARVAGVKDVIAVCPRPEPIVLAAALEAGVSRLFRLGGAHAIAALAYGTATVPRVDKIVGPGNRFVAAAKALVAGDCAIDFRAGPSEIVVLTATGRASWIAADLIAQAEHDPDARAILITWNRALAERVVREVARRVPTEGPAREALARHGGVILTRSAAEAVALVDRAAPEHLVCGSETLARAVSCAGAIFVGPFTAQVAGDYATGSNHVLPTAGAARFRGGLSAADFVRVVSVQRLTRRGLASLAPTIVTLARAEGLEQHAASIEVRLS